MDDDGFEDDGFQPRGDARGALHPSRFAGVADGSVTVDMLTWWPEDKVRTALTVLAKEGGHGQRAALRLEDEYSIEVTAQDLARLRDVLHPGLWVEIHERLQRELERELEAESRSNAIRASKLTADLIDRVETQVGQADGVAAAKMLDSVSKAGTASTNQVLALTGRPVDGKTGSLSSYLAELKKLGVVIDSTAEEVPEAAVVVPEEES